MSVLLTFAQSRSPSSCGTEHAHLLIGMSGQPKPGIDEQYMFYPTRAQFDPGSIWLRKQMLETGRALA